MKVLFFPVSKEKFQVNASVRLLRNFEVCTAV